MIAHLIEKISNDLLNPKFNQYDNIHFGSDTIFVTFVNVELELSIQYEYNFIELSVVRDDIVFERVWARYFNNRFKITGRQPNW